MNDHCNELRGFLTLLIQTLYYNERYRIYSKKSLIKSGIMRSPISNIIRIIDKTLSGMRVIKSFTLEEQMKGSNEHALSEHYRDVMREIRLKEFSGAFIEVLAAS
jgi:ABC-type multidrug transport system fused ATPase/permease subunit